MLQYNKGEKTFENKSYTHINNYIIFKTSFQNLIAKKDLYQLYPDKYFDLFKYSPTFALAMAPFSPLPDLPGLIFWNVINAFFLLWAIRALPVREPVKATILIFVLFELITATQNSQSNALMAGLIIGAFAFFEKEKPAWASLLLIGGLYIKIFALVGFSLFLFYPNKGKFMLYSIGWGILFLFLPMLIVSPEQLYDLYLSWWELLRADESRPLELSVMGWLDTWFGIDPPNFYILISGIILFCLPLMRISHFKNQTFRILFLSQILLWVIIFNHKAESATFIIAVTGVAIWYFYKIGIGKKDKIDFVLLLFVFVFTCLSPTDLFPKVLRENIVFPYVLKAVPCIFVWMKIIYDLLKIKKEPAKIRAGS